MQLTAPVSVVPCLRREQSRHLKGPRPGQCSYAGASSRLPVELYFPIIQHVRRRHDLASLAQTCRTIRSEAERSEEPVFSASSLTQHALSFPPIRQLYHEVHLSGCTRSSGHRTRTLESQLITLRRLTSSPRLASFVHSLTIDTHPSTLAPLHSTLISTPNLKRLSINAHTYPTSLSSLLSGTAFKLTYLRLWTQLTLKEGDAEFLRGQKELEELEWHPVQNIFLASPPLFGALDVPSLHFPQLKILTLKSQASARSILLQHCVTYLSQEHGFKKYADGDIFPSVMSLKTSEPFRSRHARQFPHLRYLWSTLQPDDLDAIPLLKHLKGISMCADTSEPIPPWQQSLWYAETLFAVNLSIQYVEIRGSTLAFHFTRNQIPCPLAQEFDEAAWISVGVSDR